MQETTQETTSNTLETLPYLEMGTGFIIGLAVGYALKKSFKILLFLLGIGLVTVFVLESKGIVVLNEETLESSVAEGTNMFKQLLVLMKERVSNLKMDSGLSSVAGFAVGLMMG